MMSIGLRHVVENLARIEQSIDVALRRDCASPHIGIGAAVRRLHGHVGLVGADDDVTAADNPDPGAGCYPDCAVVDRQHIILAADFKVAAIAGLDRVGVAAHDDMVAGARGDHVVLAAHRKTMDVIGEAVANARQIVLAAEREMGAGRSDDEVVVAAYSESAVVPRDHHTAITCECQGAAAADGSGVVPAAHRHFAFGASHREILVAGHRDYALVPCEGDIVVAGDRESALVADFHHVIIAGERHCRVITSDDLLILPLDGKRRLVPGVDHVASGLDDRGPVMLDVPRIAGVEVIGWSVIEEPRRGRGRTGVSAERGVARRRGQHLKQQPLQAGGEVRKQRSTLTAECGRRCRPVQHGGKARRRVVRLGWSRFGRRCRGSRRCLFDA